MGLGLGLGSIFAAAQPVASLAQIPGLSLAFNWDASVASSIVLVSNKISEWDDVGPNAYKALQATAGKRPVVNPAAQNGLNGVTFDGVAGDLAATIAALAQPFGYWAVYKLTGSSGAAMLFGDGSSFYGYFPNDTTFQTIMGAGAHPRNQNVTKGSVGLVSGILDGASSQIPACQHSPCLIDAGSSGTTLHLGSFSGSADFFGGDLYQAIATNGLPTPTQAAAIANFLANKWGLA